MKIKTKVIEDICCLSMILFAASCAKGFDDNERFSGGVTNAQLEPKYYFLGLYQSAQSANSTLKQTIGWGDYMNGGSNGTFDPLAE